jgi:hypothetical protein
VQEILDGEGELLQRWNWALTQAHPMARDERIPAGTRYDALRMLGAQPWATSGPELERYLAKGTHAELQMGAVSGLGDIRSPQAARALLSALDGLTAENRGLALEALTRSVEGRNVVLENRGSIGGATWQELSKLAERHDPGWRERKLSQP